MTWRLDDLGKARILITNDDGINARGIKLLEKIAREFSDDVWVVAPEAEKSGAGHSLTLRDPLRMRTAGERVYAVTGTPTDCVLMAVAHLLKDHPPDLVLSGINRGGNLGEDVTYSGTVAGAMEGTLLGIPSIALSQMVTAGDRAQWATAEHFAPEIIKRLTARGWPKGVFINVNFPDVTADRVGRIRVVPLGRRKIGGQLEERTDPRGFPYYWIGAMREEEPHNPDTDLGAVLKHDVAVTPVHLELTDRPSMEDLAKAFE